MTILGSNFLDSDNRKLMSEVQPEFGAPSIVVWPLFIFPWKLKK